MIGRLLVVLGAAGLAAACASAPGGAPLRSVRLPTPVVCQPSLGPAIDYPDTDAALAGAPDLFARVRLLAAGRLLRMGRERELTAALSECTRASANASP